MQFNASLLKEQSLKELNTLSLENSVQKQEKSFIYSMLEFNDTMHRLDTEEKINYYRSLAECSRGQCTDLVVQESILSGVHAFLTKAIQAIIDLFNKFINFIRGKTKDASFKNAKENSAEFDSIKGGIDSKSPLNKTKDLKVYVKPSASEIPERYIASSLNNLMDLLDRLMSANNETVSSEAIENAYSMAYKVIAKCIIRKRNTFNNQVTDSSSFKECIKADSCYTETVNMKVIDFLNTYKSWVDTYENNSKIIAEKMASIKSVIERAEANLKTRTAAMNPDNRALANKIITYCKNISNDAIWYFNTITNYDTIACNYWNTIYTSSKTDGSVNESGTIHGEIFDGDTLFDNDDIRDFNRTEWLDLELTTECYEISSAIYEYKRRVAVNEALIMSENSIDTFRKLVAMREAEGQKLGDKFMEIIQTIIQAVDKFFANLRDKMSLDAAFIKKNRDTIENKPIKLTNIKSNGDIINGLERVQKKTDVVPYNYEAMKDSLKNEREFFDKFIVGKLGTAPRGLQWSDTKFTVAELCKAYFGASMPEDKMPKVDITVNDINGKIKDIISFLEAPNALMANIRAELSSLKVQANKAATEANATQQNAQQDQPAQLTSGENKDDRQKPEGSTNESMYYSELYQRWFTEMDYVDPSKSEDNGNTSGDNKTSSNGSDSKSGFKSYLSAYRSVLLAKITGAQFVRSELMALMKAHVNTYNGGNKQEAPKPAQQQQEAPAQPQ